MIIYFLLFYSYILNNYDERFWYVFRLICTPFILLILPWFLPSILNNLFYGFFPKEFGISNKGDLIKYRYLFFFDWIWVFGLLTILTLFVSWEADIVWFGLLIIELVLLFIISKLLIMKKSKLF